MKCLKFFIRSILAVLLFNILKCDGGFLDEANSIFKRPTVLIVTLVRNKAHTLPIFLTYLQDQEYPKDRITLWIATDHNEDNSREILETWIESVRDIYKSIHYKHDDSEKQRSDEQDKTHWSDNRFSDVINLKEEALTFGKQKLFDYVFFLDADAILTSQSALNDLVRLNRSIVAPMLVNEGLSYSNYWAGMDKNYYYIRTEEYPKIRDREMVGEFEVPMVHSAVLVDLRLSSSERLTFNKTLLNTYHRYKRYNGDTDDVIIFAVSAKFSESPMTISNSKFYGYLPSPMDYDEKVQLMDIKADIINRYEKVDVLPSLEKFVIYPEKSKLSFSEIYMINLKRRPERRLKKEATCKELGIDCTFTEAVDGQQLTEKILIDKGIRFLPNYEDPYHKRKLKMGEVGCFLSHYAIWEKIVAENQKEALIFEDDIRFEYDFVNRIKTAMDEARQLGGWDLIFISRKRLANDEEFHPKSKNFIKAKYSYWANAYVLTLEGAKKLLAAKPLEKLVPTDEFIPIMYDQHDNQTWKEQFKTRNLVAWSVEPLLAYPTHYNRNAKYVSDTEDSYIIDNAVLEGLKDVKKMKHDSGDF